MKFLKSIFKAGDNKEEEISKIVPLSECSHECESCTTKFPSSVKVDDGDLYKSAKPSDIHFIIPTGKTDWIHDATSIPNTVENAVVQWANSSAAGKALPDGKISTATSSFPIDLLNPKALTGEVSDILVLPYFIWIKKIEHTQVSDVLSELVPILVKKRDESATDIPTEIQGIALEKSNALSYVFLCSHRTRDKRCGITAPLVKKEMDFRLRETGHYRDQGDDRADGVHVVFVNHVGGHKFVANVIIYLRTGEKIWLARITPANAQPIIDETVLGGGKVWPELVRVVQKERAIEW